MKEFKYKILPAVGPGSTSKYGTVKDLLFDVPYFFMPFDVIPPIHILNEFLALGVRDAGMSGGCRWKPFSVSEDEYEELVEELLTQNERQLSVPDLPEEIQTYEQWFNWRIPIVGELMKEYRG